MDLDLDRIQQEIAAAPLHSPYPFEVAVAIVNDCFRMAGKAPVGDHQWAQWRGGQHRLWPEQIGVLAHFLASTSLRAVTVAALAVGEDRRAALVEIFAAVQPLTAEMIRANRFRQEEFLRRWAEWCGAPIAGESDAQSRRRVQQLDYRKTLAEYRRADEQRKTEEERRRRLLQEAREREAAARGWRE